MKILHDGPHSRLTLWVQKEPKRTAAHGNILPSERLANEARWLHRVRGPFPTVLRTVLMGTELLMSYCGDPVAPETLPDDWHSQGKQILRFLREANCSHNDIRPDNILVLDGNLYLADFEWATKIGDPIPPEWPKALGGKYKKGEHDFSDEYSLWKSLREVADA